MIIVNEKTLEVGDIAVFRCGGKSKVRFFDNNYGVKFLENDSEVMFYYNERGNQSNSNKCLLDIVDIIKTPKLDIVDYKGLYFSHHKGNGEFLNFEANVKYDKTNRKILSVEIAE